MSTAIRRPVRRDRPPTVARFQALFGRPPSSAELDRFQAAHHALVLGVPARVRRVAARAVVRL